MCGYMSVHTHTCIHTPCIDSCGHHQNLFPSSDLLQSWQMTLIPISLIISRWSNRIPPIWSPFYLIKKFPPSCMKTSSILLLEHYFLLFILAFLPLPTSFYKDVQISPTLSRRAVIFLRLAFSRSWNYMCFLHFPAKPKVSPFCWLPPLPHHPSTASHRKPTVTLATLKFPSKAF